MSRYYIIPNFIPHLGCEFDCVFCNQKKITGSSTNVTVDMIERNIKEHLSSFQANSTIEVAFFGGSFTNLKIEHQSEFLEVAKAYKDKGIIDKIRISTRPDSINDEILDNLKKYSVDTIELGVQSFSQEVLDLSKRGHKVEDIYRSSQMIKDYNFNLGLQMMIGLPGDNISRTLKTAEEIIKLKPYSIRVYPTLVIKDTELERAYNEGNFTPLSLEEAVEASCLILEKFNQANLDVIRVGLQTTDNIQLGKDVVAGPFHPAFRQLVETEIYYKKLTDILDGKDSLEGKSITIKGNNKIISNVVGHKGLNKDRILKKYKLKKISFRGYKDFDELEIEIVS